MADFGLMDNSYVLISDADVFQMAFTNHEFVCTNDYLVVAQNCCQFASHVCGLRRAFWLTLHEQEVDFSVLGKTCDCTIRLEDFDFRRICTDCVELFCLLSINNILIAAFL